MGSFVIEYSLLLPNLQNRDVIASTILLKIK